MGLASPRKDFKHRPGVPPDWEPEEREHRRMIADAVNDMRRGKLNNTGDFVLPGADLQVTVPNILVEANSFIAIMPLDGAATTRNSQGFYFTLQPRLSFTFITFDTHPQATDASFRYAIFS